MNKKPKNIPLYRTNLLKVIGKKDEEKELSKELDKFIDKVQNKPKKSNLKH
jgi:hypothetical protein